MNTYSVRAKIRETQWADIEVEAETEEDAMAKVRLGDYDSDLVTLTSNDYEEEILEVDDAEYLYGDDDEAVDGAEWDGIPY